MRGLDHLRRHVRVLFTVAALGLAAVPVYREIRFQRSRPLVDRVRSGDPGDLSCAEVHRISTWSEERYGGRSGFTLHSAGFPNQVALEMAKRLDPTKLLLLQSEVEGFSRQAQGPWGRFLKNRDCSYFDHWVHEERLRLREALRARLTAVLPRVEVPTKDSDAVEDWDNPRRSYSTYASDEKDLTMRLEEYVRQVNDGAREMLVRAYGGNRRKMAADLVEQGLFPDYTGSRLLLAKGILGAMDPYSTYFSSDEFDEFYQDLSGGVSGIGVKVRRVPRGYLVESLIPDSPASRSGQVESGDIVVAIDGKRLNQLEDRAAKRLFKGAADSVVRLTVEKPKSGATQVISLVRRHFDFQESRITSRVIFPASERTGAIGVIEVPSFYGRGGMGDEEERSSAEDFEEALKGILNRGARVNGVVVDLRGNPGGYLEEAVSMAGLFLGNSPVVAVVGQDSQRILRDEKAEPLYAGPLVVLVDEDSASASEVLAGALKDHQRAVLVGTPHTYGKGSVQKLFHLGDEFLGAQWAGLPASGVVKLTTSVFYSPLGHSPANGGVRTHIPLVEGGVTVAHSPKVRDLDPFVDASQLHRIGEKREKLEEAVSEILLARELRPAKVNPGEEAKRVGSGEDGGRSAQLDQAVDIATELALIEARESVDRGKTVTRKP